jgi:hypothetical protein
MNCKTCDAVLVLTSVVPEQRDGARSVERHSYLCSACHATEHRLVFTRHGREDDSVPLPAPPIVSQPQGEHVAAQGLLGRVVALLCGQQARSRLRRGLPPTQARSTLSLLPTVLGAG